ncbi:MAG: PAS domain S-box protein [Caldilineaceae bacterium]
MNTATREEQIFRHIAAYSWDVFALVNERGAIDYVSPAITRLLGYTVEEYLQLGMNELTHPDERMLAAGLLQELLGAPGERRTFEIRGRHKGGHWLWLEMTAINHLHNPDLRAILVNSRDITERKAAQLELQSTAERYRLLADSIPDALFVLGFDESGMPLQVLEVNESACHLLGYSREELLQTTLAEIDDPASGTPKQQIMEQLSAGEQVIFEQTHVTRDGRRIPVEVHAHQGTVQGKAVVISLVHDISRRKHVEEELRRFEAVVRQTDDAVVIMDAPPLQAPRILFINDAFTRITGYMQTEAIHQTINLLQLPDTGIEVHDDLRNLHAVLTRGEVYRGTTCGYHKDGSPLSLQWSITPIVDEQEIVTHFVAIIRDMTEQERQVAQLQAVKSDLQIYRDHLRGILDTMEDALSSLSLPDRQLIYASASFERVLGYPPQRFLADPLFFQQVVHPDDLPLALTAMQTVFDTGFVELEHRMFLPDGSLRWLHRRAWINYDAQGRPIRLNGSARDITARKLAEDALRQSETYLRSLVDSQTTFNIRVNMQGDLSYCNKRYQEQFGWFAPSLIGLSALGMILPDDHAKVLEVVEQCMAQVGTPVQVEVRKPTRTGGYIWTLWEFIAVNRQDGGGEEIQCVGFDITQQKRAEADLRASERRYRHLFELHGLPKLIVDPDSGQIVDANPAAGQFYGYEVAVLKTLNMFDINLSPPDEVKAKMAKAVMAGMLSCEFTHRGANGTPRHVEVFTGPVESEGKQLLYSIITDTTEKQRAQTALQEAHDLLEQRVVERTAELEKVKKMLQLVLDTIPVAVFWKDRASVYLGCNRFFAEDAGLAHTADIIGARDEDLPWLASETTAFKARDLAVMESGEPVLAHEETLLTATGKHLTIQTNKLPLYNDDNAVIGVLGAYIDITTRKQAEEALKLALAQEKELGELKSRFVSMASHEFRTPLAAILAATETLTFYRAKMNDAQIDLRLDKIRQQVLHMKEIMEDVLQLARIQAGRVDCVPTSGDFDALCQEMIEEFESQPAYDGRITYVCPTAPVSAEFDGRLMRQVISNLISNALKYSSAEKPICVELTQDHRQVILQVSDEGIGIPVKDLKHLFEPFHRATNVGAISGTGLGLSITRQAVELHGGTITLHSQVGIGTTFIVTLPKVVVKVAPSSAETVRAETGKDKP